MIRTYKNTNIFSNQHPSPNPPDPPTPTCMIDYLSVYNHHILNTTRKTRVS